MVTHTFSFWPSRDPASRPLRSPFKSRLSFPLSIAWVSGWVLLFRVWTRSFFRFYLWFLVPPTPPHPTFSSIFFFIFSSFFFGFYQSVAHGPFRRRNPNPGGNLPVFASVGTTVLPPREKGYKHRHHHQHDQNPFSRAVRICICVRVCVSLEKRWDSRGGTVEVF